MFRSKPLFSKVFKLWKISLVTFTFGASISLKNSFFAQEEVKPTSTPAPQPKYILLHQLNSLKDYFTTFNVSEMAKKSQEQLLNQVQKLSPQYEKLQTSLKEISENTEKEIGEIQVKIPKRSFITYIPYFSSVLTSVEHLYKCLIFTTLSYSIELIESSDKEDIKKDVSKIIIENSLKPIEMSIELVDYISKRNLWIDKDSKVITNIKTYYSYINLFWKLFE